MDWSTCTRRERFIAMSVEWIGHGWGGRWRWRRRCSGATRCLGSASLTRLFCVWFGASAAAAVGVVQIKSGNILINHAGDCKLGELRFKHCFFFFYFSLRALVAAVVVHASLGHNPLRVFLRMLTLTLFVSSLACEQICPCAAQPISVCRPSWPPR